MAPVSTLTLLSIVPSVCQLTMFSIDRVQLMFALNNVRCMVVANNILCLALGTGRVIRIDLDHPEVVDDFDLPKKSKETGSIERIFLDPTGSHLIISTTIGDNYILHYQSSKPKQLGRLKGLNVTSIAWSPEEHSRSTGAILLGCSNGAVYESMIEPSNEYFKREDRYARQVWSAPDGEAITGLYAFHGSGERHVIASSSSKIWHWRGKIANRGPNDALPAYTKLFERVSPHIEEFAPGNFDAFAISPEKAHKQPPSTFAWVNGVGVMHGQLAKADEGDGGALFSEAQLVLGDQLGIGQKPIKSVMLTEYHILILVDRTVYGVNRFNNRVVFQERFEADSGQENEEIIGFCADTRIGTYWAYSQKELFEIKLTGDESKEIWKTLLESEEYDSALQMANDPYSRDVVCTAYGEKLLKQKDYSRAAKLLGDSTLPFETASLTFVEADQLDALYIYLSGKLKHLNKRNKIQRVIITSWIIELFMERLNALDDHISASQILDENSSKLSQKATAQEDFKSFIKSNVNDLDRDTVYEVITSHGRRDELLYFADLVKDSTFVLNYWIRMEKWDEALHILRVENDPRLTYKYSTVLLVNAPRATVDTWMRISNLDPAKLVPALMTYVSKRRSSGVNQAVRYLKYAIETLDVKDVVVYNTLITIYAADSSQDESPLLQSLQELSSSGAALDYDYALRICMQCNRLESSVYIYSVIGMYEEALRLALKRNDNELAASIADKPSNDPELRKTLWLEVAEHMVKQDGKFETAIDLLNRCELLKIEDLLPFFPDFTSISSFKRQVISSLEGYNDSISQLNKEMESSVATSNNLKEEIKKFQRRYMIIEPGEGCAICNFPLATRRFYVFPCQHAFHFDCLLNAINSSSDIKARRQLSEINTNGKEVSDAMDAVLSQKCVLCSESVIDSIDAPIVHPTDPDSAMWEI
uniref:ARAD1C30690p n=1 Tax=Blastobotrys adeninivorans TaxID=409370 RepID=A0A060T7U8_BLAAD